MIGKEAHLALCRKRCLDEANDTEPSKTSSYLYSLATPKQICRLIWNRHIQASFVSAYQTLVDLESKRKLGRRVGEAGILGSVLGGDYTKFVEKRRLAVARIPSI
jgi:hypothetical protein